MTIYIYIYIYIVTSELYSIFEYEIRIEYNPQDTKLHMTIGLAGRMFANGSRDLGSISGRIKPKTKKNGYWCLLA